MWFITCYDFRVVDFESMLLGADEDILILDEVTGVCFSANDNEVFSVVLTSLMLIFNFFTF